MLKGDTTLLPGSPTRKDERSEKLLRSNTVCVSWVSFAGSIVLKHLFMLLSLPLCYYLMTINDVALFLLKNIFFFFGGRGMTPEGSDEA